MAPHLVGHLCDGGRCAQMVEALAGAKARMEANQGDRLVAVLRLVFADPELGLTGEQQALVPVLVERHLAAVVGGSAA